MTEPKGQSGPPPSRDIGVPVPDESVSTRAGYVALIGRPNSGKSTLLNRLMARKLSIVTSKAQTTWQRVTGIYTTQDVQMIFLDTPGLLDARGLFQHSMLAAALDALREADVILLILDPSRELSASDRQNVRNVIQESDAPILCVINKIDISSDAQIQALEQWCRDAIADETFYVSALEGEGIQGLRDAIEKALPRSPFLYPEEEIAVQPARFFVAELVRETVFEHFRQEVPYAVMCRVEEFREAEDPVYIQVNIFVERDSQKGILVGRKGAAIKELGRVARGKIETFLERPVYLDLWVKVLPGWRRKRGQLRRLGFRPSEEHEVDSQP